MIRKTELKDNDGTSLRGMVVVDLASDKKRKPCKESRKQGEVN